MSDGSLHYERKVIAHVEKRFGQGHRKNRTKAELIRLYKRLLKIEDHRIKMQHRAGQDGVEIAQRRSHLLDVVLRDLMSETIEAAAPDDGKPAKTSPYPFTLVAVGGYGRSALSPGSDLDLLFLCPKNTAALPRSTVDLLTEIVTMLFDVGFKVGHAVRSIRECIQKANEDNTVRTAMFDSRLVFGDPVLFEEFQNRFRKECVDGKEREYLKVRRDDFVRRHDKHQNTVCVQEPNIKDGCGGLRDYHNIIWIVFVKYGAKSLAPLVENRFLSASACNAMEKAYHFLMRVRNELHWAERPPTDVLTLRLQGIVATNLGYPQPTILRRIEAFMRAYYRHSRAIYMHSTSLMQAFQLLEEEERPHLLPFLARRHQEREEFDGFISQRGLILPANPDIFTEDRDRLMRLFRHTQQRHLKLSPAIRKLIKKHYHLVDRNFRYAKSNRLTFEAILSSKGEVGRVLRQMHRVGFLGKYLPEFGALDCLVQHEFFHRFTADEHTLRCIEALDAVMDPESPCPAILSHFFRQLDDPYIIYLALILHDTGRAENYRYHTDASAVLASKVCRRLQIKGERRRLLLFLVDNHLVLWRTATTRNIDDPATIQEFAAIMQNREYMETLFLMTYADSKGTNEEAWSSWKEMLLTQLYRSTCAYQDNQHDFVSHAERLKSELSAGLEEELGASYRDELQAHFESMPARYFFSKDRETIARHLQLFRRFLEHVLSTNGLAALHPVLNWVDVPEGGYTQLELCGWDRSLLLARIAGTLAANRINVLSADIFTRNDGLVLDVLRVCTINFEPVASANTRDRVEKMLQHVLDNSREIEDVTRELPAPGGGDPNLRDTFPTRVFVSNTRNPHQTTMEVQALDRLGLLYSILTAIGQHHIQVNNARIATEKGAALDTFYLTDMEGKKITDRAVLQALQADVERAIR